MTAQELCPQHSEMLVGPQNPEGEISYTRCHRFHGNRRQNQCFPVIETRNTMASQRVLA